MLPADPSYGGRFWRAYSRAYYSKYTNDSGMKFSLCAHTQNDPASPWDVMAAILQLVVRTRRAIVQHIVGDFICKPAGRSVADEVVRFNLRIFYLRELPKVWQRAVLGERKMVAEVKRAKSNQ